LTLLRCCTYLPVPPGNMESVEKPILSQSPGSQESDVHAQQPLGAAQLGAKR
jgi:hypothetical protein